jgi:hypothetical protein
VESLDERIGGLKTFSYVGEWMLDTWHHPEGGAAGALTIVTFRIRASPDIGLLEEVSSFRKFFLLTNVAALVALYFHGSFLLGS